MGRELEDIVPNVSMPAEAGLDAVVTVDQESRVIYANDAAARIFRCSAADALGRSLDDFIPPRYRAAHAKYVEQFGAGAREMLTMHSRDHLIGLRADGAEFPLEAAIAKFEREGKTVYTVRFRDITERKRREEARVLLASIVESSSDAIIGEDVNGVVTSWNAGAEHVFGYTADEMIGHPIARLVPSERSHEEDEILAHMRRGELLHAFETERSHKDGRLIPVSITLSPIRSEIGEIAGASKVIRDITAQKEADRRLRESEERFHRLFDRMLEGCVLIGFDWRYIYVNPSAAAQGRVQPVSLIGRTVTEAVPGIEQLAIFAAARKCMTERVPMRLEQSFDSWNGGKTWFDMSVQPVPEGIFVLSVDITARKEAAATEDRYRRIVETAQEGIWQFDDQQRTVFVNARMAEILGYTAEEMLGTMSVQYVAESSRAQLAEHITRRHLGIRETYDLLVRRKDGREACLLVSSSPLYDPNGKYTGALAMITDITERKHAEAALLRNQKMQALGTLAGGIAHDFNNILLAIRGNTNLVLSDLDRAHPVRESLLEIEKATRRAADLVRRILAFSRQEEPKREYLTLAPVIEEALKLLRATVPKQVELKVEYGGEGSTVADATQVHQILMNLVTNSVYAIGDRPGRIDIRLGTASIDDTHATAVLPSGRYVRLTVADNGCGIEPAVVQRIFDPFFTTKPSGQGTGLGLSVVDGIMKAHGGGVTVYSEVGKGTLFNLYFPSAEQQIEPAVEKPQTLPVAHGQRILYVDDDEALVLLAERTLTRLGYSVQGECDSRAALEHFRAAPSAFDAVVTDLSMPGMPGFRLARELLTIRPDLPVIVTSGYVTAADQEMAKTIGVRALILKPNTIDELGGALDRLFKRVQNP